jgi:hypothetical protein
MDKRNHLTMATAWISVLAGLGWVFSGVLNGWLLRSQIALPSQFVNLVVPKTFANTTWQMIQPWPVLLVVFSALALISLSALLLAFSARPTKGKTTPPHLGFLAIWMCIVIAAFGTALLTSLGDIIATWPPARLAWMLERVEPALSSAGYWGIVWGWVPALIGSRILRLAHRESSDAPESGHPRAILSFAAVLIAAVLTASLPLAEHSSQGAKASTPEPVPAPTTAPLTFGSPEVSSAFQEVGENWCTGDHVSITWGEPEGATGHRGMSFQLRNSDSTPCVVASYPDVAFDDANGNAIDVLIVQGGSFMTDDAGVSSITLKPGSSAQAFLGWNAMAAAGDTRTGTMLVAPYAGTPRQSSPVDLDIIDGGAVSVTAWEPVITTK